MKGWELLKEIADGEIKEGTKINIRTNDYMDFAVAILQYKEDALQHIEGNEIGTHEFCSNKYYFEIIEEQDEINIQDIEEVNHYNICSVNKLKTEENINDELSKYSLKINELIRAIKQLDNKIKEK